MKPFVGLPIVVNETAAIVTQVNEDGSFKASLFPSAGGVSVIEVAAENTEWKGIDELIEDAMQPAKEEKEEPVTT